MAATVGRCPCGKYIVAPKVQKKQPSTPSPPPLHPQPKLIACTDCGKQISGRAASCPHCGAPTKAGQYAAQRAAHSNRDQTKNIGCLIIVLSIILGLTIVGAPIGALGLLVGIIIYFVGLFTPANPFSGVSIIVK